MATLYIVGSAWFLCSALFCLALGAAAKCEVPEFAAAEFPNVIPLEPCTRLCSEDHQVFLDTFQERKAA